MDMIPILLIVTIIINVILGIVLAIFIKRFKPLDELNRKNTDKTSELYDFVDILPFASLYINYNGEIECYNYYAKKYFPKIEKGNISYIDLVIANESSKFPFKEAYQKKELLTKDFSYEDKYYSLIIIPIFSNSSITGFIEIVKDQTDLVNLKLKNSQRSKLEIVGQLAMGISHDFNNILQVIMSSAEFSYENKSLPSDVKDNIKMIINAADKASDLSRRLLIFSGKQKFKSHQLNMNSLLKDRKKMLTRLIGENYSIELNIPKEDLFIIGDETHIEQILLNLCLNAKDSMLQGGNIKISLQKVQVKKFQKKYDFQNDVLDGNYLQIVVSDEGIGIEADKINKIFEPFFTTKGEKFGTGLGLANLLDIINLYHGLIDVKSQIGKGTDFVILLPLLNIMAPQIKHNKDEKVSSYDGDNKTILVVEDDDLIRDVVVKMFSLSNFQILTSSDVKTSIDVLNDAKKKIDLVLSDFMLPDGTGYDIYNKVKFGRADTKFIVMSGYSPDRPEIKRIINDGVTFINKPFSADKLMKIVNSVLK